MGFSKSGFKKEVQSSTGLPQETRKILNNQSKFVSKGTRKKVQSPKLIEGNHKDQNRNNAIETKKIEKINETNNWFFEKIKLTSL